MQPFPSLFFDIHSIKHQDLFKENFYVWEVLRYLKEYILSQPLGKIHCAISSGLYLIHSEKITIGENSVVEAGAYIEGPCIIGKNCRIRNGAYLRPYVIVEDGGVIGHASEIKHSIILSHACAPHFNYVGDSIIGNHVNLGAGVVCANLRLDRKEIVVTHKETKHSTGLKKLGAIIGDRSHIGCNAVLNPGTLLKKGSLIRPCSNL